MIKVSESLNGAIENFLEVTPEVKVHMANEQNPHAVTKEQVGLANLKNEEQATAAQYASHVGGEADKHTAEQILYSEGKTLKEKIGEVESGAGVSNHGDLSGRDAAGAHPVSAIEGLPEKMEELEKAKENISLLEGELYSATEQIEEIKEEAVRGCVYLTGKCKTSDYYTYHQIPLSGDARFVKDGCITMPQGSAALIEVEIIAVTGNGEHATFMNFFKYSGRIMNHNGSVIYVLNQYVADSDEYFAYQLPANDDSAPPPVMVKISDDGEKVTFEAKGDSYYDLTWKATIAIKNYTEIEA